MAETQPPPHLCDRPGTLAGQATARGEFGHRHVDGLLFGHHLLGDGPIPSIGETLRRFEPLFMHRDPQCVLVDTGGGLRAGVLARGIVGPGQRNPLRQRHGAGSRQGVQRKAFSSRFGRAFTSLYRCDCSTCAKQENVASGLRSARPSLMAAQNQEARSPALGLSRRRVDAPRWGRSPYAGRPDARTLP